MEKRDFGMKILQYLLNGAS